MLNPSKQRDSRREARQRLNVSFAEAVTGWAANKLFPIPKIPSRYFRLPWRRIFRTYGVVRGSLFIFKVLAMWPFELAAELFRSSNQSPDEKRQAVPSFSHGDHVCVLYHSENVLLDKLTSFVAEGLANGERCFFVQSPRVRERLLDNLKLRGIDVEREMNRGALMFRSIEEMYFGSDAFDSSALLLRLDAMIEETLRSGFTGLRTAGDMSRAFSDPALQGSVLDYERKVDEHFVGKKVVGFCNYLLEEMPEGKLDSVIDAHALHVLDFRPA